MDISAKWHQPISLQNDLEDALEFHKPENLPNESGCYIFFNQYRGNLRIIYIGKANDICKRMDTQFNNLKLMKGIKNFGKGKKLFIFCTLNLKRGQQLKKVLSTLEKSLIKNAFLEGHELLNIHGARIKFDSISFTGNRTSENLFERKMLIPVK